MGRSVLDPNFLDDRLNLRIERCARENRDIRKDKDIAQVLEMDRVTYSNKKRHKSGWTLKDFRRIVKALDFGIEDVAYVLGMDRKS